MPDSFWASKLSSSPAPAAPAQPVTIPWWQDMTPPAPQPAPSPGAVLPGTGITTEAAARQAAAEGHDVSRAEHIRHEGNCPSCGGGDYLSAPGGGRKRCFDCGYPLIQQGSGLNVSRSGKGTQARQVDAGGAIVHNYQPGQIVDRIS